MKYLFPSLIGGGAIAAFALLGVGGRTDAVSGASLFYTNASRTGWFYPKNHSYTSVFLVGVQQTIPLVYAGEDWDYLAAWDQSPNLGGTFVPANLTDSCYRWTPLSTGVFSSSFTVHAPGAPSMGYRQTFHFMVIRPQADGTNSAAPILSSPLERGPGGVFLLSKFSPPQGA